MCPSRLTFIIKSPTKETFIFVRSISRLILYCLCYHDIDFENSKTYQKLSNTSFIDGIFIFKCLNFLNRNIFSLFIIDCINQRIYGCITNTIEISERLKRSYVKVKHKKMLQILDFFKP